MNSNLWIRKTISSCLMVAILATYSMVVLASTGKASGELTVMGKTANGEAATAIVNGESAKSGRTIFSSSSVSTPQDSEAVLNLGSAGEIKLAGGSSAILTFDGNNVNVDLTAGSVSVLRSTQSVTVKTGSDSYSLIAGESVSAIAGKKQDDDDDDKKASWWIWAVVFGGAAAGIIIAATSGDELNLGGGTTVVSPSR